MHISTCAYLRASLVLGVVAGSIAAPLYPNTSLNDCPSRPLLSWELDPSTPPCYQLDPTTSDYSPQVWVKAGMDQWLVNFAQANGIYNDQTDFLSQLMYKLGWAGYGCVSPSTSDQCSSAWSCAYPACANWVNRQITMFETVMHNNEQIWESFRSSLTATCKPTFTKFWQDLPEEQSQFNSKPLIESLINTGLGFIPEVGSVASALSQAYFAVEDNLPQTSLVNFKDGMDRAWDNLLDEMFENNLALEAVNDNWALSVTSSNSLLSTVLEGGNFFIPNARPLTPNAAVLWPNVQPWFESQVAMGAMKVQKVFFVRFSLTNSAHWNPTCDQGAADNIASYVDSSYAGTAWCEDNNHVIIPLTVNANNDVKTYGAFNNIPTSFNNLTKQQVFDSAQATYPNFGPAYPSITPYVSSALPMANYTNTTTKADIITEPGVWSVPVCDWDTWFHTVSDQESVSCTGCSIPNDPDYGSDWMADFADWCAYQFRMKPAAKFCGQSYGRKCVNWRPDYVFHIPS